MFFFFTIKKLIIISILSILFNFDIDDIDIKFWLKFRSLEKTGIGNGLCGNTEHLLTHNPSFKMIGEVTAKFCSNMCVCVC